MNWLHRLFNPHCGHCEDLRRDLNVCKSCEILNRQLEIISLERKQLLNSILNRNNESNSPTIQDEPEIVAPKIISWKVKQQMLEAEDRQRAVLMKQAVSKSVEELEKELGLTDVDSVKAGI